MEHCCILVHTARACAASQLSTVLAAWLHWYGRLDLHTAIQVGTPSPLLSCFRTVLCRIVLAQMAEARWRSRT